jgi:ferrochelatase
MYKSTTKYAQNSPKIGVLITNLGTPDAPTRSSLKTYLKEFLSDTRVVEPPPKRWIWKLILNMIILNIRPQKSAKAYQGIWGEFGKGSPLLDISLQQKTLLQQYFDDVYPQKYQVELGMRYGNPSISSALQTFEKLAIDKIIVLPLYPQYASATTGSTFDAIANEITTWRNIPELRFINEYHQEEKYIDALATSVQEFQKEFGTPDMLLMSYHGIPKRYFENGDKYPCQCCKTSFLLAEKLTLHSNNYKMSFQSRFGREEWMKDYTDEVLKKLPQKGVKKVQVICPGFATDCLETIEEIAEENKEYFVNAGGVEYQYIPALNDSNKHIECLSHLITTKTIDWLQQEC